MDFLDKYLPILKDETFSMIMNVFLIFYFNNIYHKNNDQMLMDKYKKRIDEAENSLMMTRTQKERDLNYVKVAIAEADEKVSDLEESVSSMITGL